MSNSLPLNPFMSVRPRGKDMPSAKPLRKTNNTSSNSAFGSVKTLDARGRQTVSLKPRVLGAISIEPREQAIASRDKRARISPFGTR
jgi:hypothetical protein